MDEEAEQGILALVSERRGIDFRDYLAGPLRKRLRSRRLAAGHPDCRAYLGRLRADEREVDALVGALLIPATSFFRDAPVFRALSENVLPALLDARSFIRAWVVGAATGEEAYSLALLLAEASARRRGGGYEVLASDLDRGSLRVAQRGIYSIASADPFPAGLAARYLVREGAGVRFVESIRARVRFVEHDFTGTILAPREAIVASFDLLLCRNVLLYFGASLRRKAVERIAAVTDAGGILVLGASESLPAAAAHLFRDHPAAPPGSAIFVREQD